MKRDFLFAYYQTPRGKLLQELETAYLRHAITVSCQQTVLQIGGLGWENDFVDCSLYKNYTVLDAKNRGEVTARKIQAKAYSLPLQGDSVDMIIVPHLLEFDANRFQTMREIERVLKPEGLLLVLNFNPWSIWLRYQHLLDMRLSDSWRGHFISNSRILDWLKLLNFEVMTTSKFYLDSVSSKSDHTIIDYPSLFATAYAIKAVKRRFNLIPLTPVKNEHPRLALAHSITTTAQHTEHD